MNMPAISPYAIPGIADPKAVREEKNKPSALAMLKFMREVERRFGLPEGIFHMKHESGHPVKVWQGVSVTDIRKAIYLRLQEETDFIHDEIASFFGVERSTISTATKKGKWLMKIKYDWFIDMYEDIKKIPLK